MDGMDGMDREMRGEDGHPGLGVGKLDAWGRWVERVVGPKSEAFGPGWVTLREGVFSATSKAGETMVVSRKLLTWEVVVTRGAGFSITAHADGVSAEAARLMALEMALVIQVGCEGWAAEKARFFEAWDRGVVGPDGELVMPGEGTTEHTEDTEGKEGGIQRGDAEGMVSLSGALPKIGGVWVENPECPGAWRLEHEGKEQVLLAGVRRPGEEGKVFRAILVLRDGVELIRRWGSGEPVDLETGKWVAKNMLAWARGGEELFQARFERGTTEHTEHTEGKEGGIQRGDAEGAEAAGFERGVAAALDVFERIGFSRALMKDVEARVEAELGLCRGAVDDVDEVDGVDVEAGLPVPEVVLLGGAGFGDVYPPWLWERVPAREVGAVAAVLEGLAASQGIGWIVRAAADGTMSFTQVGVLDESRCRTVGRTARLEPGDPREREAGAVAGTGLPRCARNDGDAVARAEGGA